MARPLRYTMYGYGILLLLALISPGDACVGTRLTKKVKRPYDRNKYTKRGTCEEMNDVEMCQGTVNRTVTFVPSILKCDQNRSHLLIHMFTPLVKIKCSPHLPTFLCSAFFPACSAEGRMVLPCRSLCRAARDGCITTMTNFGFPWPDAFDCNLFPENDACFRGNVTDEKGGEDKSDEERLSPFGLTTEGTTAVGEGNTVVGKDGGVKSKESTSNVRFTDAPASKEGTDTCKNCPDSGSRTDETNTTECVVGHFNCRDATARAYFNSVPHCCLHGNQMTYTTFCHSSGNPVTSCRCLGDNLSSETPQCLTPDEWMKEIEMLGDDKTTKIDVTDTPVAMSTPSPKKKKKKKTPKPSVSTVMIPDFEKLSKHPDYPNMVPMLRSLGLDLEAVGRMNKDEQVKYLMSLPPNVAALLPNLKAMLGHDPDQYFIVHRLPAN